MDGGGGEELLVRFYDMFIISKLCMLYYSNKIFDVYRLEISIYGSIRSNINWI